MGPTLGQRLRALRIEQGLSQADLAGELVSPSYVSLIEAGKRSPEPEVLEGLARKLGCSPLYLESGIAPEEVNEQRLKLQFAEIALANGETAEARALFTALAAAGSRETRLNAIWGLARTEETAANLQAAVEHLDVLLDASRAGEPGAPGLLTLLVGKCRLYQHAGDFARGIEIGESARREVRELGLEGSEDEIRLASTLVASYWGRGDLFSAQQLAAGVVERAERLGSRTAQGNAYWNASLVADARGQLTLALDLAARALALLSESAAPTGQSLAALRVTYAWLLLRCDVPRIREADALLGQAHAVLAEMAFAPPLAACETEMARSALLRGDLDEAVRVADAAAARLAASGGAELHNARVVAGLARIMLGEPAAGAQQVSAAAAGLAGLGSRLEAAQAWRDLGECLLVQGRSVEAIDALRHAADCAGARSSSISTNVTIMPRVADLSVAAD
jgi:transcriptional regulator with XRE-family HTH domain